MSKQYQIQSQQFRTSRSTKNEVCVINLLLITWLQWNNYVLCVSVDLILQRMKAAKRADDFRCFFVIVVAVVVVVAAVDNVDDDDYNDLTNIFAIS